MEETRVIKHRAKHINRKPRISNFSTKQKNTFLYIIENNDEYKELYNKYLTIINNPLYNTEKYAKKKARIESLLNTTYISRNGDNMAMSKCKYDIIDRLVNTLYARLNQ
jgi:hypothetical protein